MVIVFADRVGVLWLILLCTVVVCARAGALWRQSAARRTRRAARELHA